MLNHHITSIASSVFVLGAVLSGVIAPAYAASIDDTNKHIWSENVGWLNAGTTEGAVSVLPDHLEGYIWSDNIGWIRLGTHTAGDAHTYTNTGNTDYGVNRDSSTGELSGYAWSENAGWINFGTSDGNARIMDDGVFSGYVWSDNIGWIKLAGTAADGAVYGAKSAPLTNAAPTFTAFSAAIATTNEDTEVLITLADLMAQGDEADSDGMVDGFVVSNVTTGTLRIGADASTATVWNANTNRLIDARNNGYWTPAEDANGTLNGFTVKAVDNDGDESATAVQAQFVVGSVNDAPTISAVSLAGELTYNQVLTANVSGYSDPDTGDTTGDYIYQWQRATEASCTTGKADISGANSSTYTLTSADVGSYICVTVTPRDSQGLEGLPITGTSAVVVAPASQQPITVNVSPSSFAYNGSSSIAVSGGSGSGLISYLVSSGTENCSLSGATVIGTGVGSCTITAVKAGDDSFAVVTDTVELNVFKAAQTINFDAPATKTYGDDTFAVTATSSAGLSVGLSSTTPEICQVTAEGDVTVSAAGSCQLSAEQSGDAHYAAASAVTKVITVNPADQSLLTLSATPSNLAFNDTSTLAASGGNGTGAVTYAVTEGAEQCSLNGTTITATGVGTCTITATKAADANYSATTQTVELSVAKAEQSISFDLANTRVFNDSESFGIDVTGGNSDEAVVTISSDESVCTVAGNTVEMVSVGACRLAATQAGDDHYEAAEEVSRTIYLTDPMMAESDTDTDDNGIGDALEQTFGSDDADNDGIPDALETLLGANIDATTDTDGDGTPDVIEVLNDRDPTVNDNSEVGAPTVMVSTSKALLAKGILSTYTQTELSVSAEDEGNTVTPVAFYALGACETGLPYNYQSACTPVPVTGYTSGTQSVWWVVVDSDNNWAQAKQTLNILPRVSFNGDLVLAGTPGSGTVETRLVLSGPVIAAPSNDSLAGIAGFTVPFTLGGTGTDPADYDLPNGAFTIQPGATESDPVTLTLGNDPTHGDTVVITLDTEDAGFASADDSIDIEMQFVTAGEKISQTIAINQIGAYPPRLSAFKGSQGTAPNVVQGLVFDKAQGNISLSALITDPDGGRYTYSWSGSDSELNLSGVSSLEALIDVDGLSLPVGEYYAELQVTDTTAPGSPAATLGGIITLINGSDLSAKQDSDGDGLSDAEEGLTDSDGDGIPDYQDALNQLSNVVPSDSAQPQNYVVKTQPGLRITFGTTAVAAKTGDTKIDVNNLADHGNNGKPVSDAQPENVTLAHLFDYEVENIAVPEDPIAEGYSVQVTLPLDTPLTADSVFTKYGASNGWGDFVEDSENQITWANWQAGVIGTCPEAGDLAYSVDTTQKEGANCVQVMIQDGGPNDADGVVNGRIIDPLGISSDNIPASAPDEAEVVTISTENDGGSGGGSMSLIELLLGLTTLLGLGGWRLRRRLNGSAQHTVPPTYKGGH